jgi:hypothetical protein
VLLLSAADWVDPARLPAVAIAQGQVVIMHNNYFLGALTTGTLTLLAALGGVWLTQRHAARLAHEERIESRRSGVRTELTSLIVEVRALIDSAYLTVPFMAKAKFTDLDEFANTDSGREMGRRHAQIKMSLTHLDVLVGDAAVAGALAALRSCIDVWAEEVNGPALKAASEGGDAVAAVGLGWRHTRKTGTALDSVVTAAAPLLRISISDDRASAYHRLRRWVDRRLMGR